MTCRPGVVGRDLRRRTVGKGEGVAGMDGDGMQEEREEEGWRGFVDEVGKVGEREDEGKAVREAV